MESLVNELQSAWNRQLTMEEKTYAARADVAQWNKAKGRVHIALPKMRDFIHRATWMIGAPERKRLEDIYKSHVQAHVPFADVDAVLRQLEDLRKDRQVLESFGRSTYQQCRNIAAEIQGAYAAAQRSAVANARRKKGVS
jgi:hypothetical protein